MTLSFSGALVPRPESLLLPPLGPPVQPRFIDQLVAAFDDSPFDAVRVGQSSTSADAVVLAQAVLERSARLAVLVSTPPALADPVPVARAIATLAALHPGRVHVRLPLESDPDAASRAAEFAQVVRAVWTATRPRSFRGRWFELRDHWSAMRPDPLPLVVADVSVDAKHDEELARSADVLVLPADAPEIVAGRVARLRALADGSDVRVAVAIRPVLGDTRTDAASLRRAVLRVAPGWHQADVAESTEAQQSRMLAGVTGAVGQAVPFVGTPDVLALRVAEYAGCGVDGIHLRGFDPLADVARHSSLIGAVRTHLEGRVPKELQTHVA